MNLDEIYTSLGEAEIEIKRRHKDKKLKKKLDDFWGENTPDFIHKDGPRSVLSKPLVTPNLEFKYFLDITKEIDMDTCFWEYSNGKFVGKNQEKRHLGKMFFYHGHGKKNGSIIDHKCVVDFTKEEGKRICDVNTVCDKNLIDFHHKILKKNYPKEKLKIKDISKWFDKTRYLDAYYLYYLSLFIRDHILFENFFFDDKEESKFTYDKFLPSFKKVTELFGYKPLIVPLLPHEHEKSHFWLSYDEKTKKIVEDML